jgi:hypothetical protein
MKKTNSTSFFKLWGWLVALAVVLSTSISASAQCTMVCNNLVQISLDQDCEEEILPDMILEGGGCPNGNFQVQAKVNNVWVPANGAGNFVATSDHINQTLQVRVRDLISGNMCWGYIHVEDKLAPVLTCQDITISCAVTTYTPAYLFDELGIDEAYPDVDENCSATTQTYIDTWNDLTCTGSINGLTDISAYVRRIWSVVDASGNVATCTQYIYFERRHIGDVVFPADVTVSCESPSTSPSATGTPYVLDFGQQFPIFPGTTFCELNGTYSDQILPVCDGTYKILRTWTVHDWCLPSGSGTNPIFHIQIIKVSDEDGPVVQCPDDITAGTDPNGCLSYADLPDVIIEDNCSQIASIVAQWQNANGIWQEMNGTLTNFPGNNLWAPDTLGVLGIVNNMPIGDNVVKYIVTDDCGNSTVCTFTVTIEDNSPPTTVCDKFTQVSLGIDGVVYVNATTFDDGSYDNCSPIFFKVRRMDSTACQTNDYFFDQAKFCCEDVGDTVTVILRVYDVPVPAGPVDLDFAEWHYNECMVHVFVDDKLNPTCSAPANVTVSCEAFDPSLWAYGSATATDNCCIDTIITTANYNLFDTLCERGTITRTFRAIDCGGRSSTCTQRVIVTYEQDYYIKFPNDVIVTECDGTGNFGAPVFFGEDCELLAVGYQDQFFTVVPDACYKIERTWTINNWCTYTPNNPCVNVPNPNPNTNTQSPQNLPGPIVSPITTPGDPWRATLVSITPGAPQTSYSIFYNPNANCYVYKQIIKVIDGQKPTIDNCPASPVEYCDLTANDPLLWNQMYWYDPIIDSHDLCEGDAPLSISASDLCSGSNVNISFLLFLDLDGDGTMETVINSNNPPAPGTVQFNNLNTPNYGGGETRIFDGRPVLPQNVYRWAVHQSVSGSTRTGAVQWKTLAQLPSANNPGPDGSGTAGVVPQLPYGTHKIKWQVTDGCGNEQTCEYHFVVKDCKAPTIVCHQGLGVNIMPGGMIAVWATDFLQYGDDNCTPADQLIYSIRKAGQGTGFPVDALGNPIVSVNFDCTELGDQLVELWAMDAAGNADYCETFINVQDNNDNCNSDNKTVAGALKTEMGDGLEDAAVYLQATPPNGAPQFDAFDMTDSNGAFMFANSLPLGSDYTLTPSNDGNPTNGVSTYDLVLITKHILGIEPLGSPYKMIAADANKNNSITTFDIVEIRKLILGINSEFPDNTSWRFVDKDFVFPDPTNPFQTQFPEIIQATNVQSADLLADFVSVKIGDVNNSVIANSFMSADDRSAGTLFFDVKDRSVIAGEEFAVDFKAADKTAGYQFTLNTNGLEVLEVIGGENVKRDNFAVFSDAVTASVEGNAGAFSIKFRATIAGELSKMLSFSHRITRAESYSEVGERLEVALRFDSPNGPIIGGAGFELMQNTPNPVSSATNISFTLPEAAEATLTISNVEGRTVKVVKGAFAKGLNSVTLQRGELEAGILFYRLETPTHSAVLKMIVTE